VHLPIDQLALHGFSGPESARPSRQLRSAAANLRTHITERRLRTPRQGAALNWALGGFRGLRRGSGSKAAQAILDQMKQVDRKEK
jgi:hypothetical protein